MVNEVTITGFGTSVPGWATQTTLEKLVDVLDPKTKTNSAAAKDQKENTKALTDAEIAQKDATARNKILGQNLRDLTATVGKSFSNPESFLNAFSGGLGRLGGSLESHAKYTNSLTDETKAQYLSLSKSIAGVAKVMGVFAQGYETMMKVNKGFLDLYDTGMRFQGGMTGMMSSVMDTGLTLDQFAKVTKSNTQAAAMFGTATPRVIKSFMDLTGQGGSLMMSQEQAAESFMSASEIYQNSGLRQGLTDIQLGQRTSQLIKDLNGLSQATGQSRNDILKFVNDTFKKPETIALMSTLPEQMKAGFLKFTETAALMGPDASKKITAMMEKMLIGKGNMGLMEENQQMMMAALPQLRGGFMKLYEDMKAGRDTTGSMIEMSKSLDNIDPNRLGMILAALPPEIGAFVGSIKQARKIQEDREKVQEEEIHSLMKYGMSRETAQLKIKQDAQNQEKTQKALNKTQADFNKSWIAIELSLVQVGKLVLQVMQPFARLLGGLATLVGGVSDIFDKLTSPLTTMIDDMGMLGTGINYVISALEAFAIGLLANSIMGGGGMIPTGKKIVSGGLNMAKNAPGMLKGLFFGAPAASAGAAVAGETALATGALSTGGGFLSKLFGGGAAAAGGAAVAGETALATGLKGAAPLLGSFAGKGIPLLGGGISFGAEYAKSGNAWKSLFMGAGSVIGGLGGAAVGSLAGPLGTAAGAVGGSYLGESIAESLYNAINSGGSGKNDVTATGQSYELSSKAWQDAALTAYNQMNAYLQSIDQNISMMRLIAQGRTTGAGNADWLPSIGNAP